MVGPPPPRIQNIIDSVPGNLPLTPYHQIRYQDWIADSGSPNFLSLDTTVDTGMADKCRTSCTCTYPHSMEIQQQDTQATTWSYPISPKNPTTTALEPSSSFHSTLTPAAHRAVSELFPELAELNCSCFEVQGKSNCGIIPNPKNFAASKSSRPVAAPRQEGLQLEPLVPMGLSRLRERGAVPKRVKREESPDIPTNFFTRPPVLSTIPAYPFQSELLQLQLSPDLVGLGLKGVWLLQYTRPYMIPVLTHSLLAGLHKFYW